MRGIWRELMSLDHQQNTNIHAISLILLNVLAIRLITQNRFTITNNS